MRRADRLFQLILLLRGRKKTTARWLADALEVSERTIYRDIHDLMCSGVPIEGEAGFGYVLLKNFELPPLMFSKEELQALRLGVGMVAVWSSEKLEEAAENALRKINAAVPPAIQDSLQVLVVPKLHHPPILGLDEIYQAISHQNQMQINYVRRDGQTSDRLVCPLGLTFWGTSWTLTAWCELRQDFRNFRLDRIQVFKILPIPFTPQKGRTFNDYLALVGGHAPSTAQSTQEVRPVK